MANIFQVLQKNVPNQLISWLGILGGALTIVGNLEGVLTLSNWARAVISNWSAWVAAAWGWLLQWFALPIPSAYILSIWTVSFFIIVIAISARFTGGEAGSWRATVPRFRFAFSKEALTGNLMIVLIVLLLVIPAESDPEPSLLLEVFSVALYIVAIMVAQVIADRTSILRRLKWVVGVVVMIVLLNWLSVLASRLAT